LLKQIGGPTGNTISARWHTGALTVKTEEKKPTAMNPMPNLLRRAALPAVASLLLAAAAADTTGNLQKTFTVTPGGTLVIEADRGAIDVTTGGDSQVTVQVDRKVTRASETKATELLASHTVTFQQDGNRVTVKAKLPAASTARWFGPNLQVHYQVVVPKNFNLDLQTAGGSVAVADLTGQVKARTAGGSAPGRMRRTSSNAPAGLEPPPVAVPVSSTSEPLSSITLSLMLSERRPPVASWKKNCSSRESV